MRPTRRGWALLVVAVVGLALGVRFGARSLDALVVPSLVALTFGAVQVYRRSTPSVLRAKPAPGFPGETRTVGVTVKSNLACDVHESVDDGLRAIGADARLPTGGEYEYDLELLARGEHVLGPATVAQRDTLGLVRHTTADSRKTQVLVYPDVLPIANRTAFAGLVEKAGSAERESFDRLREYTASDSLRDVNWKASAKRTEGDFVVTEFAAEDEGGITVAAEAAVGHADAMAAATASVLSYLLDADLLVDVVAPDGEVDEGRGEEQRTAVLELLARTGPGRVEGGRSDRADVHVVATDDGVRVRVGSATHRFEDLVATDTPEAGFVAPGVVS